MPSQTVMRTHGVSALVDFPADFQEYLSLAQPSFPRPISRDASGLTLTPSIGLSTTHSVYIPVPTPSFLEGYFMNAHEIFILFESLEAVIETVNLYGAGTIQSFDKLGWTGIHDVPDDSNTLRLAPKSEVTTAILLEIVITFPQPFLSGLAWIYPSIRIASAGVVFVAGESLAGRIGATVLHPN